MYIFSIWFFFYHTILKNASSKYLILVFNNEEKLAINHCRLKKYHLDPICQMMTLNKMVKQVKIITAQEESSSGLYACNLIRSLEDFLPLSINI